MIVRSISEAKTIDWGNGESRRFLLAQDGMGYSLTDTLVRAGTTSALKYERHLEACYCVGGKGEVVTSDGARYAITPGTMYALDQHDAHHLIASEGEDLHLVCVFSPALAGDERHNLAGDGFSRY